MRVKDICTRSIRSCTPERSLADAGWAMWETDCGVLPVLGEAGLVLGMITDRDIAIGATTQFRPAAQIAVKEVISGRVHSCALEDGIHDALATMVQERIRRLPVVDAEGKLQGVLSLNDIALAAVPEKAAREGEVTFGDLAALMKAISSHPGVSSQENHPERRTSQAIGNSN